MEHSVGYENVVAENVVVDTEPVVVDGNSSESMFFTLKNTLSSWSLPKNKSIRRERIRKFDEFIDEEPEGFEDQDVVSVSSSLSELIG